MEIIFPATSEFLFDRFAKQDFAPSKTKMPLSGLCLFCGERGIRTPGGVTLNGFQDRRIRPLCHLSGAKIGGGDYPAKL